MAPLRHPDECAVQTHKGGPKMHEPYQLAEQRAGERVPVFHRTRMLGPDGQALSLVIVDLSQKGLMARCDQDLAREARIQVNLPGIGMCYAVVRWSLGGRIGCELEEQIAIEDYHAALSALALPGG